jgi:hypothetical protein
MVMMMIQVAYQHHWCGGNISLKTPEVKSSRVLQKIPKTLEEWLNYAIPGHLRVHLSKTKAILILKNWVQGSIMFFEKHRWRQFLLLLVKFLAKLSIIKVKGLCQIYRQLLSNHYKLDTLKRTIRCVSHRHHL